MKCNIQNSKLIKWIWTLSNISHSTFRLTHFIMAPKMEWICRLLSWQIVYCLCFPTHVICLLRTVSSESNLAPTIDAIVQLPRHRYLPDFSAEVCIVTTNGSTLSQTHPELIRLLNSQHPVKFATEQPFKTATKPRYANVVLLDVTGWEQVIDLTQHILHRKWN